jgi:hypothetical protein
MIRQAQREAARKSAELARQQKLLQKQIDEDWRLFVEKKDGTFVCMHKPTDLLQTEPPFHPLPNIRFLFFHAEEGLRYLFICQVSFLNALSKPLDFFPSGLFGMFDIYMSS